MVEVTELAEQQITEQLKGREVSGIRIFLNEGGWGGPSLSLALDEPQEGDETYNVDGIDILVDKRAMPYAVVSTVDYIDSMWGKGFTIRPAYGGAC